MAYFASWWLEFYFCVFALIFGYYCYFKFVASKYWSKRNIVHPKPNFLIGNMWRTAWLEPFGTPICNLYRKYKKNKLVGIWNFINPELVVTDLDLIKTILVKDFSSFQNHGFEVNLERDPLAGHLFNLTGSKWRNLRVKLTPTFTSGKMKMMFTTMIKTGEQLLDHLKPIADRSEEVEVKDILARFTTDIISSCAFGIESNSLKNPNSEFRIYGRKLSQPSLYLRFLNLILISSQKLFDLLKLKTVPEDIEKFFVGVVRDTINYREENNVTRNDFLQLLIQLKNKGKLDDVDENFSEVSKDVSQEDLAAVQDMKFSFPEAAAQAFVFFFAGFETSATTLTFALYELALNKDIQTNLQKDIDRSIEEHDNKLTYDAIMDMKYLDWVVQETLRKYPPVPILMRKCNKDFEIPELGVTIEKGTQLYIPIGGIHWDPEYFPNPARFDPNRFSPQEKAKRDNFTSLQFGEGPRICIGNRFALLQTKVGLASIFSRYNVEVSANTIIPMKYDPANFILSPQGGVYLKFEQRQK